MSEILNLNLLLVIFFFELNSRDIFFTWDKCARLNRLLHEGFFLFKRILLPIYIIKQFI